ncbi:HAMP domain-containing sensor histidine kinase [Neobacillus sp. WH10]|uniref:sensor histidine kinase n=1 Tax=Neobacillus sp. WH10 TaxID=3047873 RepID=UPI0024C1B91F|nr:HAMP domain-containing sensor histidine kinase [Neobacillus sp. WH10]WHY75198.1 HAMP domain-containing sensor histidine kinase [Neobacillus sp. WH10]
MASKNKLAENLIKNYVFFSITTGMIIFLLLVMFNYRLLNEFGESDFAKIKASEIVQQNYVDIQSEAIEKVHGWIEILDDHLRVIYVKGEKQDIFLSYTEKEINRQFYDLDDNLYHATLAPFETKDGRTFYCFVKIPKKYLSTSFQFSQESKEFIPIFWKFLLQTLALCFLLFIINVYIYSRWTAGKITSPLRYISEGIRNVANGQFYKRLHFKSNYELQQLQEQFNIMAEKLEKAEMEKKQLEESKQRMLVDISHDLKTPITSIQGYIEALQRGLITDEKKKQRTLDLIHTKTNLVTALIEDVFELSKLESPDYPFTKERSDITEFIRQMAIEFYYSFSEKNINFHVDIPEEEISMSYNHKLLYRAVSNILSNALTYNPAGTKVLIQLKEETSYVRVSIIDNGIGISESLKEKIFEPFARGDHSRKSDGGTGLGLTISKNIIKKHGGQIELDTSMGKTVFQITLFK